MNLALMRNINLLLSGLGTVIFAALFLYISLALENFDRRLRDFAIARVQERVGGDLNRLADSRPLASASRLAGAFSQKLQQKVDGFRADLRGGREQFIADLLTSACKLDCERRQQVRGAVRDFYQKSIARYGVALDRIQAMVVGQYQRVMDELRHDLRIFAGTSFLAFAFALALSLFRGNAARHLLPISLALTVTTVLAVVWYAFGQDWVMTIIFGDYWGWAYAVFLSVLMLLMADIAASKARITSGFLNVISSAPYAPC